MSGTGRGGALFHSNGLAAIPLGPSAARFLSGNTPKSGVTGAQRPHVLGLRLGLQAGNAAVLHRGARTLGAFFFPDTCSVSPEGLFSAVMNSV